MSGIPSNPVDVLRPVEVTPDMDFADPQNVWSAIMENQDFVMDEVVPRGYRQPETTTLEEQIVESDRRRADDTRFLDARNLASLARLLRVEESQAVEEFDRPDRPMRVLDVGSGQGQVGSDIEGQTNASVFNLDFSRLVLGGVVNDGPSIQAVGMQTPFPNGAFDRVIDLFATTIHSPTSHLHAEAFLEQIRLVGPGGRIFRAPEYADMFRRSIQWRQIQMMQEDPSFYTVEIQEHEIQLIRQASMDAMSAAVISTLVESGVIDFTPALTGSQVDGIQYDNISGIFDVRQLPDDDTLREVREAAASFSPLERKKDD